MCTWFCKRDFQELTGGRNDRCSMPVKFADLALGQEFRWSIDGVTIGSIDGRVMS